MMELIATYREQLIHLFIFLIVGYTLYDTFMVYRKKAYITWPFIILAQLVVVAMLLYQLYLFGFMQVLMDPALVLVRYSFEMKVRIVFLIALAMSEILKMKRFHVKQGEEMK